VVEARILELRRELRRGPHLVGGRLGIPPSTVHAVLRRHGLSRLARLDRVSGIPIRYERSRPGELVHVDVKKLGRVPDGGGWRAHGREIRPNRKRGPGYDFLHVAIDDHSRFAFVQVHPDERGTTCARFLIDALTFFADLGITVERVMTDNALNYTRSRDFKAALEALRVAHRRTANYRPQTNGKAERFNRTLLDEWAYVRVYRSEIQRTQALQRWLHLYNHHRSHTSLGGHAPMTHVNNLPGQYN